jgi:hypothetical protein
MIFYPSQGVNSLTCPAVAPPQVWTIPQSPAGKAAVVGWAHVASLNPLPCGSAAAVVAGSMSGRLSQYAPSV